MLERAHALHQAGRFAEAAGLYDEILRRDPSHSAAAQGLARLNFQRGHFEEALRIVDNALALQPGNAEWWSNRGTVLAAMKRLEEAAISYGQALAIEPQLIGARANRALSLLGLRRYREAAQDFEAVLRLNPDAPFARGNLIRCKLQCCDWQDLQLQWKLALGEMRAGKAAVTPMVAAALCRTLPDQLTAAIILSARKFPPQSPLWRGEIYAHPRVRLAYLSADFHAHATATLMAGLFEHHDRAVFESVAISFGPNDASPMRRRLEGAFERFLHVPEKSDAEIARLLREMEIDIAVDLKGYTSDARPGIFAHRPAPIQVNYLGYPATMGAPYIDYIVADRIVIADEDRRYYSEKVVTLPDCYQPNDSNRAIADAVPSRAQCGLPPTGFVFCCFNNPYKITEEIFSLWMEMLREVPDSVLWLLADNQEATDNLRSFASKSGIAPQRLVFAEPLKPEDHLARHALADLFLDTLPYNAHTTASDALWAGLPLLTCKGGTFAGRVSASLLQTIGLGELVTHSLDDYRTMALNLARDAQGLAGIKAKLGINRTASPLFNTGRVTRHLEAAYRSMVERQRLGLAPTNFTVASIPA